MSWADMFLLPDLDHLRTVIVVCWLRVCGRVPCRLSKLVALLGALPVDTTWWSALSSHECITTFYFWPLPLKHPESARPTLIICTLHHLYNRYHWATKHEDGSSHTYFPIVRLFSANKLRGLEGWGQLLMWSFLASRIGQLIFIAWLFGFKDCGGLCGEISNA